MTKSVFAILALIAFAFIPRSTADNASSFKDFKGKDEFGELLLTLPLIAETGGGHIFKMPDNSLWLIGIGSTTRQNASVREVERQHKMTRLKAQAAVGEFLNGTNVSTIRVSTEVTEIRNENGKESALVTETLDESIVTKAKGIVSSLEVIGTWTNLDGTMFFQAIGKKME